MADDLMDSGAEAEEMDMIWKGVIPANQLQTMKKVPTPNKRQRPNQGQRQREPEPQHLVKMLARLVLRQESTLTTLLTEQQFLFHMGTGQQGLVQLLMSESQRWHHMPQKPMPLRHLLICCLLKSYHQRVVTLMQSPPDSEVYKACQNQHIIDSQGNLPYLRWCTKKKRLVATDKFLTKEDLMKTLKEIESLLEQPEVTLRFHSLRKIPQEAADMPQSIPWIWTISMRTNPQLWQLIHKLCFHGTWQLAQLRLKPQSHQRSGLANEIQKALH